jgi:tRNA A37 threonylcarbamoyladenosine synthetase subunit TsaC/SUA5/YrdC
MAPMNTTPSADEIRRDALRIHETLAVGGVAILPLTVAYGILGHTEGAIRRIFAAKQRSYEKPSGMFSNRDLFEEVHIVGQRERDVVKAVTVDHDLPLSVVAPFRRDHPVFRGLDPFVLEASTKAGTLDMLFNAGPLHNEMARLSHERSFAVLGSSANRSLTGSKYRLEDIDAEVRAAADLQIDYGLCRYANDAGISSTIISLVDYSVVRRGVCFDAIADVLRKSFGIELDS